MDGAAVLDGPAGRGSPSASDRAFALTAACCRWPVDVQSVRTAAAETIDWRALAALARRHRVAGLVHEAVLDAALPLPADVAGALAREARAIALQNLAYAHESARLQRLFDQSGIPLVFLKGVALSQDAYGALAVKHGRDIDLLVPPAHVHRAFDLLRQQGYAVHDPARYLNSAQLNALVAHGSQVELVRRGGRLRLELHWRLAPNARLTHGIDPFADNRPMPLPGAGSVNVLRPEDEFVYLCVHGAGHGWSRLKWLADLNARLNGLGMQELVRFHRHAEVCGAGLCSGQALLLCRRLLGRELPEGLYAQLSADARVVRLVAIAMHNLVGDDPGMVGSHTAQTFRNIVGPFLLGRGARFLAAQMGGVLIGRADAVLLPLPRALVFVYPMLRVPLWLWRQRPRRGKRPLQAASRR